jgi:phage major head subunit gpT-like protein
MPVVRSDILALTLAGLKTDFEAAYNHAQTMAEWNRVATELPTTLPVQDYGWLGRGVVIEEFKDKARAQDVNQFTYELTDKTYKGSMKIQRRALEDDQYGILVNRTKNLAQEAVRHWNKLAYTGLALGFTTLCYDGQFFFDTDHSEGSSGTQSNKGTAALDATALGAAEVAMIGIKDDKGEPMEVVPDTLIVGPKNKQMAWELTNSGVVVTKPDTTSGRPGANYANYWEGRYNVFVSPYLTGAYDDYWFLLDTKKNLKPIIIQSRSDVPITVESDLDNPRAAMNEEFQFDVRGRYVQGYSLWQLAYGAIL